MQTITNFSLTAKLSFVMPPTIISIAIWRDKKHRTSVLDGTEKNVYSFNEIFHYYKLIIKLWKKLQAIMLLYTAQCYAQRGLCYRKMSVRPSASVRHTPVFRQNGWTYQTFSQSGNPTILVFFHTKQFGDIRTEATLRGGRMQGAWKIVIFDQYLALSRKWCKIALVGKR